MCLGRLFLLAAFFLCAIAVEPLKAADVDPVAATVAAWSNTAAANVVPSASGSGWVCDASGCRLVSSSGSSSQGFSGGCSTGGCGVSSSSSSSAYPFFQSVRDARHVRESRFGFGSGLFGGRRCR